MDDFPSYKPAFMNIFQPRLTPEGINEARGPRASTKRLVFVVIRKLLLLQEPWRLWQQQLVGGSGNWLVAKAVNKNAQIVVGSFAFLGVFPVYIYIYPVKKNLVWGGWVVVACSICSTWIIMDHVSSWIVMDHYSTWEWKTMENQTCLKTYQVR